MGRDDSNGVHGREEDDHERASTERGHKWDRLADEVGVDLGVGGIAVGSDAVEDGGDGAGPDVHGGYDAANKREKE